MKPVALMYSNIYGVHWITNKKQTHTIVIKKKTKQQTFIPF